MIEEMLPDVDEETLLKGRCRRDVAEETLPKRRYGRDVSCSGEDSLLTCRASS